MAAVVQLPSDVLGPAGRCRPGAPRLTGASPAVYRRRRLMAAVVGLAVACTSFMIVRDLVAVVVGDAPPVSSTEVRRVVVAPGDTVTSIAAAVAPPGDRARVAAQIQGMNGGSALTVGQAVLVPGG